MKNIDNVKTEDIEKQTEKIPKKFFQKSKYIMRNPDLELEDYLTLLFDIGLGMCAHCGSIEKLTVHLLCDECHQEEHKQLVEDERK